MTPEEAKPLKIKSYADPSTIPKGNEMLPPLQKRTRRRSYYLKEISALSTLEDTFNEPAPNQDFQNEDENDVEKRKEILRQQKKLVMRAKRMEREEQLKDYDTSKLITAIGFLSHPSNGGDFQDGHKNDETIMERRKSLVKILSDDLKL